MADRMAQEKDALHKALTVKEMATLRNEKTLRQQADALSHATACSTPTHAHARVCFTLGVGWTGGGDDDAGDGPAREAPRGSDHGVLPLGLERK